MTKVKPFGNTDQDYFIRMNGITGITIEGCLFKFQTLWGNAGRGIWSYNTSYAVKPYLELLNVSNCRFENLNRGIYAINSGRLKVFDVIDAEFIKNQRGLYMSGFRVGLNPLIKGNTFDVLNFNSTQSTPYYGMYLDHCSGYHVEENVFTCTSAGSDTLRGVGLIVNNSGGDDNFIYRNSFNALKYATIAQNQNRFDPEVPDEDHLSPKGLCYKCNSFNNCVYDISVTKFPNSTMDYDGIKSRQGSDYPPGDPTAPAGNAFSQITPRHWDLYNDCHHFYYFYHEVVNVPYVRVDPEKIFGNVTDTINWDSHYNNSSCPSWYDYIPNESEMKLDMQLAIEKTDSISAILLPLIDGGSTEDLVDDVLFSTSSQTLETYEALMNESPFLTDTVMETAIIREEVLPNAMIRDVLVANPQGAKSDEVLEALDVKTNPMEEYLMEDIMQGLFDQGEKEEKETQLSHWGAEYALNFNRLVRVYLTDTIHLWAKDSLIYLLDHARYLPAKYGLANLYLEDGEYEQAFEMTNSIPSIFTLTSSELADVDLFYNFVYEAMQLDTLLYKLPDPNLINPLLEIASINRSFPSAFARNLLISANLLWNEEEICLPVEKQMKSSRYTRRQVVMTSNPFSSLRVFPNPAKEYIIVYYKLETPQEKATMTIHTIEGKNVLTIPISGTENQVVIPTGSLKNGIYMLILTCDQVKPEHTRFIIAR